MDPQKIKHKVQLRTLIAGLLIAAFCFVLHFETDPELRVFVFYYYFTGFLIWTFFSGRWIFALTVQTLLFVAIAVVGIKKFALFGIPFFMADLYFFVNPTMAEVLGLYSKSALLYLGGLMSFGAVLAACFFVDRPLQLWRREKFLSRCIGLAALPLQAYLLFHCMPYGEKLAKMDFWNLPKGFSSPVGMFLASVSTFRQDIKTPYANPNEAPLPSLTPVETPPDIFLVLEESTFDPGFYQECESSTCRGAALFQRDATTVAAGDLEVHTFGGFTAVSEFATLSGFPHLIFGANSMYAPFTLAPRTRMALPRFLKRYGYESFVVTPIDRGFLNSNNAYASYGFDHFYARDELPGLNWYSNDQEIFTAALKIYDEKKKQDPKRPLFVYVLTLRQHGPHDTPLLNLPKPYQDLSLQTSSPRLKVGLSDYLSRLEKSGQAMAKLESTLAEMKKPMILAYFGDHLPAFAKELSDVSRKYTTYYQIKAFPEARPIRDYPRLDIAFLGSQIIEATHLPFDEFYKANADLKRSCAIDFRCAQVSNGDELTKKYLDFTVGTLGAMAN